MKFLDSKRARRAAIREARLVGDYPQRGKVWADEKARVSPEVSAKKCGLCGMTEAQHRRKFKQTMPTDHIVPLHACQRIGQDPDKPENLLTICVPQNLLKAVADKKLANGDVIGYKTLLERMGYPMERVERALGIYGFR